MKKTKYTRRLLATLLAFVILLGMLPETALAALPPPRITVLRVNGVIVRPSEGLYMADVIGATTTTINATYFGQGKLMYNGTEYASGAPITVETPPTTTGTTTVELTLTSTEDPSFQIDYTVQLFNNMLIALDAFRVLLPEWGDPADPNAVTNYIRSNVNRFVNGSLEGTMFQADEDGVAGEIEDHSRAISNYRTHFLTETDSVNIRFSNISQPGYIRIFSNGEEIVGPEKFTELMLMQNLPIESGVNKLTIELCRDATYDNEGFVAENSYDLFVDRLSVLPEELAKVKITDMVIANVNFIDPEAFTPDSYRSTMLIAGKEEDVATYTFFTADSDTKVYSHTVLFGVEGEIMDPTVVQTGEEYYTFEDTITTPGIAYISLNCQRGFRTEREADGYTFGYLYRFLYNTNVITDNAFEVIDYIVPASQYTNNGAYGLNPERLYHNSLLSLGNFGGYVTLKFTDPIINDTKNPYGVDLYINGNSFGSPGFSEPGNVWVSNDGIKWYLLAGSDYFDDHTIRDYEVTYTKVGALNFRYTDNLGKTDADPGTRYQYPLKANYPLYKWEDGEEESMTFRGPLLVSDATDPHGSSSAAYPYWGYVDVNSVSSGPGSPYSERTEGFDLSWAFDTETGLPVSLDSVQYVKVSTASHIYAGAIGEKSTEVQKIYRAEAVTEAVGKTAAPGGIRVNKVAVALADGTYVYDGVTVPKTDAFVVSVTAPGANVFINSFQGDEHTYDRYPTSEVIRVVVQEGEKEPLIYYLNLNPDENVEGLKSSKITFIAGGIGSAGKFDDGEETKMLTYTEQSADTSFPIPTYSGRKFLGWFDEADQKIEKWDETLPAELTLTAKWEYISDPQTPQTISVTFRLIGSTLTDKVPSGSNLDPGKMVGDRYAVDLSEGDAGYHGAKYVTWIPTRAYRMNPGDTNYDLFIKAMSSEFGHEGAETNYVKGIRPPASLGGYELREMTNGNRSGWMYTVNGKHPGYGLKEFDLKDGDNVVWHYVNDYLYEIEDWDDEEYPAQGDATTWNRWLLAPDQIGGTGGGSSSSETQASSTILTPKVTAKDETATVSVGVSDMNKVIAEAKKNKSDMITIKPAITGKATKTSIELPKSSLNSIVSETDATLKVETPVGTIHIPQDALTTIASQADGTTVIIVFETVDTKDLTANQQEMVGDSAVFDISILSGEKQITSFDGKSITISLPYTLETGEKASDVKVWYLNDKGELEEIECSYDEKTGLATFKTDHLSYYLVGVETAKDDLIMNFTDIKESDWFYQAVKFALEKGLFKGTSETSFSPNESMTRAMLVTVLHRLEGLPEISAENNFTDVKDKEWYTDAILWASENSIVKGYGDGLFGTNDDISREQVATILMRFAKLQGLDTSKRADFSDYSDASKISSWAQDAMEWANAYNLIKGRSATSLAPQSTATRAEVASILQRFVEDFIR